MDRWTAQSECVELSTGTKISRYTGTSPLERGEYVSHETGCQVSGGTSCRPSESQTVIASTGQASHARSNRSRSTAAGTTNTATVSSSSLKPSGDRKSTRLNSSHGYISYAVFCLKKKKKKTTRDT